jgi:hypothetical protein
MLYFNGTTFYFFAGGIHCNSDAQHNGDLVIGGSADVHLIDSFSSLDCDVYVGYTDNLVETTAGGTLEVGESGSDPLTGNITMNHANGSDGFIKVGSYGELKFLQGSTSGDTEGGIVWGGSLIRPSLYNYGTVERDSNNTTATSVLCSLFYIDEGGEMKLDKKSGIYFNENTSYNGDGAIHPSNTTAKIDLYPQSILEAHNFYIEAGKVTVHPAADGDAGELYGTDQSDVGHTGSVVEFFGTAKVYLDDSGTFVGTLKIDAANGAAFNKGSELHVGIRGETNELRDQLQILYSSGTSGLTLGSGTGNNEKLIITNLDSNLNTGLEWDIISWTLNGGVTWPTGNIIGPPGLTWHGGTLAQWLTS